MITFPVGLIIVAILLWLFVPRKDDPQREHKPRTEGERKYRMQQADHAQIAAMVVFDQSARDNFNEFDNFDDNGFDDNW